MLTKNTKRKINIVSLGCSKNLVDSEELMKQLQLNNLEVTMDSNDQDVHSVVINTCGFIKDAKEESVNEILAHVKAKENKQLQNVYVMGCLSERYKADLEKEIPEVDAYFGVNNIREVIEGIGYNYKDNLIGERTVSTPKHYAYLKISEGCDRQCSFCAIPLIRGKHKSKPIEQLVKEAENIVSNGASEIILIAQDLTYYGVDIYKKQELASLLKKLADVDGLKWLRLHYAYPASFPYDILPVISEKENICNYLDIPFQHISTEVLKKMRRGTTSNQIYSLIERLRSEIPNLALRTTLLTGHPGEGAEQYNELVEFVERVRFDRLGIFTYSEEENTFSARNFKDEIPEEVKSERAGNIMEIQRNISNEINKAKLNTKADVMIDRFENGHYIGRTYADSPEVDNEVIIQSENKLTIGSIYEAKISKADDFDLFADI